MWHTPGTCYHILCIQCHFRIPLISFRIEFNQQGLNLRIGREQWLNISVFAKWSLNIRHFYNRLIFLSKGKPIQHDPDFKGAIIDRRTTDFKCCLAFAIFAFLWLVSGIIGRLIFSFPILANSGYSRFFHINLRTIQNLRSLLIVPLTISKIPRNHKRRHKFLWISKTWRKWETSRIFGWIEKSCSNDFGITLFWNPHLLDNPGNHEVDSSLYQLGINHSIHGPNFWA